MKDQKHLSICKSVWMVVVMSWLDAALDNFVRLSEDPIHAIG